MIRKWFERPSDAPQPRAPEGERLYAVGDVHGRIDLLERMLEAVERDAQDGARRLLLLGDIVDRGPASADVVERALSLAGTGAAETIMGNHEHALLGFLRGDDERGEWLEWGGDETLRSYGIERVSARSADDLRDAFADALPDAHRAFLEGLPLTIEAGDYLFVHAGVRPGVALDDQEDEDLLWIRSEFHEAREALPGKVVVHGHHPARTPADRPWRIGVDTGAVWSGVLTAAVLEGESRRFLSVRGASGDDA